MTPDSTIDISSPSLKGFLWRQGKFLRTYHVLRVLSIVAITPFLLLTQIIVDQAIPAGDTTQLWALTGISLLLLAVHVVTMYFAVKSLAPSMQIIFRELRARVFHKINFMSFRFLDSTQAGKLISKYSFDTNNIEMTAMMGVTAIIPETLRSLLLILILMIMNPWLAGIVLVAIPLFACARLANFNEIRRSNHLVRLARERMTGQANEYISAIRLVRGYGQEDEALRQVGNTSVHYSDERVYQTKLNQSLGYMLFTVIMIISILSTAFCGWLVINDMMSLGHLVALVGALPICLWPVSMLTQFSLQYLQGAESYRSIKELLDSDSTEKWTGTRMPEPFRGEVEFDQVTFQYHPGKAAALKGLNTIIRAGEHVALVGSSGSGKSTFIGLLLGFYAPTSGEIRIDSVPQPQLSMQQFRQNCSIVMQDNILLSGSVLDNIRFGKVTASLDEVREVARHAYALEFIEALPNGFDTVVGERGATLSGGQRQRIAIARALLRDPKILILDEATSALDYESEKAVQQALDYLAQGRTTITIAHRLSTVRKADRILLLQHGEVEASGTWQELSSRAGSFRDLLAAHQ
ncbi:MAG: ABC transporter ATP-binding protein [Verrucomicrobiota bacterium]